MDNLKFSIIIPTYNRNRELSDLLESLTYQTYKEFEIVVIDDSPQNEKIDISNYYNIKYIKNERNLGAAESRNIGVSFARGEWLVFLDDDDRFDNDKLSILDKYINIECNFIYHPIKWIMVNERSSYITHPEKDTNNLTFDRMLIQNQIGGTPGYVIKKNLFLNLGGFNNNLKALEDYDFLLRLVTHKSFSPIYVNVPLTVSYCYTKRTTVSKNIDNTINAWNIMYNKYVKSSSEKKNFELNKLKMLAYTETVNLNRKSGLYYLKIFYRNLKIHYLVGGIIGLLSPKFLIKLRHFIS